MFEFLSSPFGLVAVGLGVLAVAVLALCLWITALDRRMRGMADGLEAERRKVAEMQMVIGRRANAARSYGSRRPAAGVPAGAPMPTQPPVARPQPGRGAPMPGQAPAGQVPQGRPAAAPRAGQAPQGRPMPQGAAPQGAPRQGRPAPAGYSAPAGAPANAPATAPRPAPAPGAGWTPSSIPMPSGREVDAWVQNGSAKPFDMPDKKMSRKARREAERAFAARAAAELEARQARRAQEAAYAQRAAAPGQPPRGAYPAAAPGGRHAR
ncbi:hypothetical protein [uncultured Adlercreutzia sp.]|uniref:hypothetical protein n=1 Tax=uncultured Adlercreutzia sp. TaxID=875803 RepID=UPI0026F3C062|nr:hypothetical protein [uncultured Adlercreutzia sp.]